MRLTNRLAAALLAIVFTMAACSGSDDGNASNDANGSPGDALVAQVASFDLVADRPGRFIVGLFGPDRTQTLAYGTVTFRFTRLAETDTETDAGSVAEPGPPAEASFLPIPGQDVDLDQQVPRLVGAAEATGVYGAGDVTFDQPGFWEVTITATLDGRDETTTAAFEVLADSDIPTVGDPAPRTRQPLAGSETATASAIDSRAGPDRAVPDPDLHDLTIADALDAGRPFMVVVSTPTFCVSRFCGPITDSVADLAQEFADTEMAFIHLEVWEDFEANQVNAAAREWIAPTPQVDGAEPWVFVVDVDGIISHRFDNVATDAELRAAVEATLET